MKFYLIPSQYNKWEYQQRENKKEFDLIKEVIELWNDYIIVLETVFMLRVVCMMSLKVWKIKRKLIDD